MTTRIIESKFHGTKAEVEAPLGLTPGSLVSWLQDNDPEALNRVCPYEDCSCEIDEWDEGSSIDD